MDDQTRELSTPPDVIVERGLAHDLVLLGAGIALDKGAVPAIKAAKQLLTPKLEPESPVVMPPGVERPE